MKKFLLFPLLVFMTAFIVPACSGDDEEIFPPEGGDSTAISDSIVINDTIVVNDSIVDNDTITIDDSITDDTLSLGDDIIFDSVAPLRRKSQFEGYLIVNGNFEQQNIICEINIDETYEKAVLKIYNVKFAENMPVSIDMTLNDIICKNYKRTSIEFSGDSIVPMMGVAPFPAYTFTNIEGGISKRRLEFSATLTKGTFTFRGRELL